MSFSDFSYLFLYTCTPPTLKSPSPLPTGSQYLSNHHHISATIIIMSKTVEIKSAEQFNALLKSSRVVVADCEFTLHPPSIMDGIGYTPPSSRRPPPPAACRGLPSMRRDDGPTRFQSFFFSFLFAYHIFTFCKQPLTGFL